MFQRLKEYADPRNPRGYHVLPHAVVVLLIALGLILAFGLGFFSGWQAKTVHDARFFQLHYNVRREHIVARRGPPIPVRPRAIPASASIDLPRYPAVGDQGPMGSCAAWATAWQVSYEWRRTHPNSWLRFNPRQLYDHYSDTYNGGQDGGSWPDQDIEISSSTGLLQYKMLPEPPYVIDNPLPTYDAYGHLTSTDAAKHRFPTTTHPLGPITMGGGQGLVDNVEASIAAGHATLIAIPVYPEFDNATQTNGLIGMPQSGEGSRGGHEIVAVAYQPNMHFPDGYVGTGIEVQNQWNTWWGVQGRGWLEDRFVAQYVFGAEWIGIGTSTPASTKAEIKFRPADGGNTHLHNAPGAPTTPKVNPHPPKAPQPRSAAWYVHGVVLTTGQDVSGLLNYYGDKYKVWPVGLAATLGIESGLNPNAERWAGGLDNSCGISQIIITNVAYYTSIQGARAECNWEEVPANAIYLMTRIYAEYFAYQHNCVTWPFAYGMYNGGAGYPCSYYYNPSGDIAAHVAVFDGWYNFALSHWQGGIPNPPPPPPTPKKAHFGKLQARVWGQYRKEHHRSFIPHNGWFAWHWRRGDFKHVGGIVQHEQYDSKNHVMFEVLQGLYVWWHPHHAKWGTQIKGHPWIR